MSVSLEIVKEAIKKKKPPHNSKRRDTKNKYITENIEIERKDPVDEMRLRK